jgi:hypothetical protein
MSDFLPSDVVVKILIRLPVKSLVRLRCVCKDWCSLISSNTFIATHTNRDDNNKSGLLNSLSVRKIDSP